LVEESIGWILTNSWWYNWFIVSKEKFDKIRPCVTSIVDRYECMFRVVTGRFCTSSVPKVFSPHLLELGVLEHPIYRHTNPWSSKVSATFLLFLIRPHGTHFQ
jgi:hypothetical protein